jgi:hypothetical protein
MRGGKPVIVEKQKLCGITVSSTVRPKPTPKEQREDWLRKPALITYNFAWVAFVISVAAAIAFANQFTAAVCKKIAIGSGVAWVLSALRLYSVGWGAYLIIGGLALAIGYLIYRTDGKSIIRYIKEKGWKHNND